MLTLDPCAKDLILVILAVSYLPDLGEFTVKSARFVHIQFKLAGCLLRHSPGSAPSNVMQVFGNKPLLTSLLEASEKLRMRVHSDMQLPLPADLRHMLPAVQQLGALWTSLYIPWNLATERPWGTIFFLHKVRLCSYSPQGCRLIAGYSFGVNLSRKFKTYACPLNLMPFTEIILEIEL